MVGELSIGWQSKVDDCSIILGTGFNGGGAVV